MKCPNCNAEITGTTCEYCRTEIQNTANPQTQQPINIIINNINSTTDFGTGRVYAQQTASKKNTSAAIALCCLGFIGLGGMHRFYVGKKASGIAYVFTLGFFLIGTIIDLISLSKGEFTDCRGYKLKGFKAKTQTTDFSQSQQPVNTTIENTSSQPRLGNKALWIIAGILSVLSLGAALRKGTGFISSIFLLISAFIVSPISNDVPFSKNFLIKYKPLKIVLPVLLFIISFVILPDNESKPYDQKDSKPVVAEQVETTAVITTSSTVSTTTTVPETTVVTTMPPTEPPTEPPTPAPTEAPYVPPVQSNVHDYVLNTSTMKFHRPGCSSADEISPENRAETSATRDDIISWGYDPCGRCNP